MKFRNAFSGFWFGLMSIGRSGGYGSPYMVRPGNVRPKDQRTWTEFGYSSSLVVVREVLDGDTVELNSGERVRLMGVDAPEMKGGRGARLAKEYLRQKLEGKMAFFERAPFADKYGRSLGYLIHQGENINQLMLHHGLARTTPFEHPLRSVFEKSEAYARSRGSGVWQDILSAFPEKLPAKDTSTSQGMHM